MTQVAQWAGVAAAIASALAGYQLPHPYDQIVMAVGAVAAALMRSPFQKSA